VLQLWPMTTFRKRDLTLPIRNFK